MQRRYNLAHFLLASVVALGLTPLIVCVDAQAQIAFASNRDGHFINREIYVMNADGGNPQNLTKNDFDDWYLMVSGRVPSCLEGMGTEIYVMDADQNQQRILIMASCMV